MCWFPFVPPEGWMVSPEDIAAASVPETFICELCKEDLQNTLHVELSPPGTIYIKRKFHSNCLIAHLLEHMDDMNDEIVNFITRKPVSNG